MSDHTVQLAKARLIHDYDGYRIHLRKWAFGLAAPDSYQNPEYRTGVWVRLGSPPKGYVLDAPNFSLAVSVHGRTRRYVKFHICDVDYRPEHRWLKDPLILEVLGEAVVDPPEDPVLHL